MVSVCQREVAFLREKYTLKDVHGGRSNSNIFSNSDIIKIQSWYKIKITRGEHVILAIIISNWRLFSFSLNQDSNLKTIEKPTGLLRIKIQWSYWAFYCWPHLVQTKDCVGIPYLTRQSLFSKVDSKGYLIVCTFWTSKWGWMIIYSFSLLCESINHCFTPQNLPFRLICFCTKIWDPQIRIKNGHTNPRKIKILSSKVFFTSFIHMEWRQCRRRNTSSHNNWININTFI